MIRAAFIHVTPGLRHLLPLIEHAEEFRDQLRVPKAVLRFDLHGHRGLLVA